MRIKQKQQNRRMATTASTMSSCRIKTTIGVIGSLGVCIFIYLCQTLRSQPLFPFQNDSLGMCIVIQVLIILPPFPMPFWILSLFLTNKIMCM